MELIWMIYWVFLFLSLLLSVMIIWKYHRKTGIIQLLLTIVIPIWALLFIISTNWVGSGTNEFMHMFEFAISGSISAIAIMIGYLALIGFFIYDIFILVTLKEK